MGGSRRRPLGVVYRYGILPAPRAHDEEFNELIPLPVGWVCIYINSIERAQRSHLSFQTNSSFLLLVFLFLFLYSAAVHLLDELTIVNIHTLSLFDSYTLFYHIPTIIFSRQGPHLCCVMYTDATQ